jgi:DNA-binding IclR family transcriptional regulator
LVASSGASTGATYRVLEFLQRKGLVVRDESGLYTVPNWREHKIGERENTPTRLVNKDAHDLYRILRAVSTDELVAAFERLLNDDVSRHAT